MKFGKTLLEQQIPEWSKHYISYKSLKKCVKDITDAELKEGPEVNDFVTGKELEKVNSFFMLRKNEAERRLRIFTERYKLLGEDKDEVSRLLRSYNELKDLTSRCIRFADLNKTGFLKIIKKFDKKTQSVTKEPFLNQKLSVFPFADEQCFNELLETVDLHIKQLENAIVTLSKTETPLVSPTDLAVPPQDLMHSFEVLIEQDDSEGLKKILELDLPSKQIRKFFELSCKKKSFKCIDFFFSTKTYVDIIKASTDHDERNILHRLVIGGGFFDNEILKRPLKASYLNDVTFKSISFPLTSENKLEEDTGILSYILQKCPQLIDLLISFDSFKRIPLHYAVHNGYFKLTEVILDYHQSFDLHWNNFLDVDGNSPLFYAVLNGSDKMVSKIVNSSDTYSVLSTNENLLHLAARKGFVTILSTLVNIGLDVNLADTDGETPLHVAAKHGQKQCVEFLLKNNGNLNLAEKNNGRTPLFMAAVEGHVSCLKLLMDKGAFADQLDNGGWTAHDHAVYRGNREIATLLRPVTLSSRTPAISPVISPIHSSPFFSEGGNPEVINIAPSERTYGHHFLKDPYLVILSAGSFDTRNQKPPLEILNEKYSSFPALSVLVTGMNVCGDPIMIDFPLQDYPSEPILFYAKNLLDASVKLDLRPTFGSKRVILGRAFFLLSTLNDYKLNQGSAAYRITVPFMNDEMNIVALFHMEILLVSKFYHKNMKIMSKNVYWKSVETKVIGHRGAGANSLNSQNLQIGENTVLSLVTAASLGAEYVEFDVQLTKEGVPVIYHDWVFSESGLDIPIHDVTLKEFKSLGPTTKSPKLHTRTNSTPRLISYDGKSFSYTDIDLLKLPEAEMSTYRHNGGRSNTAIKDAFATLEELLTNVPSKTGFNIEVKYPSPDECEKYDGLNPRELNDFIDKILACVFEHASERSIIFSSFHPETCLLLNLKQPNYPVFFLTDGGMYKSYDTRCNSLYEAVRFAKFADLLGIVSHCDPLIEAPYLISAIKENGILLFSYGQQNNDTKKVALQKKFGMDAVIVDKLLPILGSINLNKE